jgi:hypothetical protein
MSTQRLSTDPNVIVGGWKNKQSREVALMLLEKYGPPQDASLYSLTWFNNGFWVRTTVKDTDIGHNFPMPHTDCLWQWTAYSPKIEKIEDCFNFHGSVLIDPTFGEIGGRCHSEESNFLTTNMVYEIMEGKRSWQDARLFMAKVLISKEPKSYIEGLVFSPRPAETSRDAGEMMDISNVDLVKAMATDAKDKLGL